MLTILNQLLPVACLILWGLVMTLVLGGTFLGFRLLRKKEVATSFDDLSPVTILKPLKGLDEEIFQNLESFFCLNYPAFEILFSVVDKYDPVVPLVEALLEKYPQIDARLLIGEKRIGSNPKVNNLARSYEEAKHPLIYISDSNTRVQPDYLAAMVAELGSEGAMIFSLVAGEAPESIGGCLDAVSLNTFCARGTLLSTAGNFPCVTGKAIVFWKEHLDHLGGLQCVAHVIAEDFLLGQLFGRSGLKVILSRHTITQHVGTKSFAEFWSRFVRWGRIRKTNAPTWISIGEPIFTSVGAGLLGAFAFGKIWGVSPLIFLPLHFSAFFVADYILMRAMNEQTSLVWLPFWLMREFLHIPLWIHSLLGNSVQWRGQRYFMEKESAHPLGVKRVRLIARFTIRKLAELVAFHSDSSWPLNNAQRIRDFVKSRLRKSS